eukprot:3091948-Prymnesium_polylepis.1
MQQWLCRTSDFLRDSWSSQASGASEVRSSCAIAAAEAAIAQLSAQGPAAVSSGAARVSGGCELTPHACSAHGGELCCCLLTCVPRRNETSARLSARGAAAERVELSRQAAQTSGGRLALPS